MSLRVAIVTTHPVQYQAPLFRALAARPGIDLTVVFGTGRGTGAEAFDPGFARAVAWDVDLLAGYRHVILAGGRRHLHGWRFDVPGLAAVLDRISPGSVIVFGWNKRYYWRAWHWARRTGTPLLVRGDSNLLAARPWPITAVKRLLYPRLLRGADGFLVPGEANRAYLGRYGVPEQRMFPAPHSVDNAYFRNRAAAAAAEARALRRRWGVERGALVFLFVGKLEAHKRPGDAIAAIMRVAAPGCRLVLVGDGPLMGECRRRAGQDACGRVHLAGFKNQSELPAYYAAADALVLPSGHETWGLVVNEAMACGRPCLVSDGCGCAADLVRAGETGFTFPRGDVAALAALMQRLADAPALARRMGEEACRRIERYSPAHTSAGFVAAMGRVVAAGKARDTLQQSFRAGAPPGSRRALEP